MFHAPVGHSYVFSGERSVQVLSPFLKPVISFCCCLLLSCGRSSCIFWKSISYQIRGLQMLFSHSPGHVSTQLLVSSAVQQCGDLSLTARTKSAPTDHRLKHRPRGGKAGTRKHGAKPQDIGLGSGFTHAMPKGWTTKGKVGVWGFVTPGLGFINFLPLPARLLVLFFC